MNAHLTRIAAVTSALLLALVGGCAAENPRVADIAAMSASPAAGRLVYEANCVSCHGADLKGVGGRPDLTEHAGGHGKEDLLGVLLDGQGGMPSFEKLTDQEAADVICYVQSKAK